MAKAKRYRQECCRCSANWRSYVKKPKRCRACGTPYWNKPKQRFTVAEKGYRGTLTTEKVSEIMNEVLTPDRVMVALHKPSPLWEKFTKK